MDIKKKNRIVEKIMESEDDILLNEIDSLLTGSKHDFWNDLPEDVKRSIDQAKTELDNGQGIPHQQIMSEIKARYLNK
ncbi:MAG: hypothetical protein ACHQHN_17005 [Sphingobacteriales bacterium]